MDSFIPGKNFTLKEEKSTFSIPITFMGLLALSIALMLLAWNESRDKRDTVRLNSAATSIQSLDDSPSPGQPAAGKLFWHSDEVKSNTLITDEQFDITAKALKMRRRVAIYQWVEDPARINSYAHALAYEKEYTYTKVWKEGLVDSRKFNRRNYLNPTEVPVDGLIIHSNLIKAGAHIISNQLLASADNYVRYIPNHLREEKDLLPAGTLYLGEGTPENPKIGDMKVWWEIIPEGTYSLLAAYKNNQLVPYEIKPGQQIGMMMAGVVSRDIMLSRLKDNQKLLTWYLRALGSLLCLFAMYLFKLARSRQKPVTSPYAIG